MLLMMRVSRNADTGGAYMLMMMRVSRRGS